MTKNLPLLAFSLLTLSHPLRAESSSPTPAKPAEEAPKIQLAILLDTSSSMDGLIGQAKSQLWKIVNEFIAAKQDGKAPNVEVALYEYGNSGLAVSQGYVRQVCPLTNDLDKVSEELFALKTNGGDEYCGWVIRDAVDQLAWSASPKAYKAVFIAGNEPFSQGPVKYQDACKKAVSHGIVVNTIHCGTDAEGVNGKWRDGAALADGRYLVINQDARQQDVAAPQDREIAELNTKLNETYVAYGSSGKAGKDRQMAQDKNTAATAAPAASMSARAVTKASANYDNAGWDLVDASRKENFDLSKVKEADLPEELRALPADKRAKWVEEKAEERKQVQQRISQLAKERERFVAEQQKNAPTDSTLEAAVRGAVREQAATKAFEFKK